MLQILNILYNKFIEIERQKRVEYKTNEKKILKKTMNSHKNVFQKMNKLEKAVKWLEERYLIIAE